MVRYTFLSGHIIFTEISEVILFAPTEKGMMLLSVNVVFKFMVSGV